MTVKELRKQLKKMPSDAEVLLNDGYVDGEYLPIKKIREVRQTVLLVADPFHNE